jgi:hypothetical protein
MEQAARKWPKGMLFLSSLKKGTFLEFGGKNHVKEVHFELEKGTIFTSCYNSKRV